jgi:hypothetical protein
MDKSEVFNEEGMGVKSVKRALITASALVTAFGAGITTYADTQANSTVKATVQQELATLKNLNAQEKTLDQQLKATKAAWATAHVNPLKNLTADQTTQLNNLKADLKNVIAERKELRDGLAPQVEKLKAAKQSKDKTQVKAIQDEIKPTLDKIKALNDQAKNDIAQIKALIQPDQLKAFRAAKDSLQAYLAPILQQLKTAVQARRADHALVKADRQAKNMDKLSADLGKLVTDEQAVISAKQALLAAIQSNH